MFQWTKELGLTTRCIGLRFVPAPTPNTQHINLHRTAQIHCILGDINEVLALVADRLVGGLDKYITAPFPSLHFLTCVVLV